MTDEQPDALRTLHLLLKELKTDPRFWDHDRGGFTRFGTDMVMQLVDCLLLIAVKFGLVEYDR